MRSIERSGLQHRVVIALAAIAAVVGAPFSESAEALPYAESTDFGVDTHLTDVTHGQPAFSASAAMALDLRGVNRAWGDSEDFAVSIEAPHVQKVVLDFEDPAPFRVIPHAFWYSIDRTHSTPCAFYNPGEPEQILQKTRQYFVDAGISNIDIRIGRATPGATVVYFANSTPESPAGYTIGLPDRYNKTPANEIIVYEITAAMDGETAAHELGHALGLRHVNPPPQGGVYELMASKTYDTSPPLGFLNDTSFITDASNYLTLALHTHNPVYHLKRYLDGVPDDVLQANGIHPGTWDMDVRPLKALFGFGPESARVLYNVDVLLGYGEATSTSSIAHFDEISTGDLAKLSFDATDDSMVGLLASSVAGGVQDLRLAIGDPASNQNAYLPIGVGAPTSADLYQSVGGTYVAVATATVSGVVIAGPDFDADADVDLADFGHFQACFNGPNRPYAQSGCQDADFDADQDVDLADFSAFQSCFNGPNRPAACQPPPRVRADLDNDGDVDLADFLHFQACFNGPNRPYAQPNCSDTDLDGDQDVDLADFLVFQSCFNGPNRPPACR